MKRTALVTCLAAVMLLALAVPAFAADSGTVYGKAVLAPYAIVVSGGGTDPGNPLTYQGNLGQWAPELFGQQVMVQNVGTQSAEIRIAADQLPTDGINMWDLTAFGTGDNVASWTFFGPFGPASVLQQSNPEYNMVSRLDGNLMPGGSTLLNSEFRFPTASNSNGDHNMSAIISVVEPI